MSTAVIAPVTASKPVAKTIASKVNDSSAVSMPVSVTSRIGCFLTLTRRTFGRL
jgi:hypothetical protein